MREQEEWGSGRYWGRLVLEDLSSEVEKRHSFIKASLQTLLGDLLVLRKTLWHGRAELTALVGKRDKVELINSLEDLSM